MDLRILFWNLHRKDLSSELFTIAAHEHADVVAICEPQGLPRIEQTPLNAWTEASVVVPPTNQKIRIFSRSRIWKLQRVFEHPLDRMVIVRMTCKKHTLLLAVVHLGDPMNWSESHRLHEALSFSADVRTVEESQGHQRTIMVGDFNMNPFEPGMINAGGFHAVMTKEIAMERSRTVQQKQYPYFYNPMWGFFGDRTPGPAGTYFLRNSDHHTLFHHILDQVLLGPDVLELANEDVRIVTQAGDLKLCSETGRPNSSQYSDHCPVLVRLNLLETIGVKA